MASQLRLSVNRLELARFDRPIMELLMHIPMCGMRRSIDLCRTWLRLNRQPTIDQRFVASGDSEYGSSSVCSVA